MFPLNSEVIFLIDIPIPIAQYLFLTIKLATPTFQGIFQLNSINTSNAPEIHSLWRSDFDIGPNEENAIWRKSDDIVKELLLDIDDLQNFTDLGTKQVGIFYDEELLFFGGPE